MNRYSATRQNVQLKLEKSFGRGFDSANPRLIDIGIVEAMPNTARAQYLDPMRGHLADAVRGLQEMGEPAVEAE